MRVVDYPLALPAPSPARENPDVPRAWRGTETWTLDEIDRAERLWREQGLSAGAIGLAMGRSRAAVCGMISRNRARFAARAGGKGKRQAPWQEWTAELLDLCRRLFRGGMEPVAISAETGVPLRRLMQVISRRGDLFAGPKPAAPKPRMRAPDKPAAAGARRETAALFDRPGTDLVGLADLRDAAGAATGGGDGPCGLMDLTERRCKWPVGGERAETLFCGGRIDFGAVYCGCHRARAVERRT